MLITEVKNPVKSSKFTPIRIKVERKQNSMEMLTAYPKTTSTSSDFSVPFRQKIQTALREKRSKMVNQEDVSIKNLLYNSMPEESYEQKSGLFQGQEAMKQYYKSFKNLGRINKEYSLPKVHVIYLKEIEKNSVYPEPLGIVSKKGSQFDINLNNYKIGDKLGTAFSKALPFIKNLDMIQLKQNRLSDRIASKIVKNVSKNIKDIDLSYNKLSEQTIEKMCRILKSYQLIQLQIEGCELGDTRVKPLLEALQSNTSLEVLNLAKNNLTDKSGELFRQIVVKNTSLKKVDLHYNLIRGQGAIQFLSGMIENVGIEELDYSWNSLGTTDKKIQISQQIALLLEENGNLIHLDISNNLLDVQCCQIISDGLKKNSSLLGIHINGNDAKIDHLGFMHPMKINEQDLQHLSPRIFNKKKFMRPHVGGQNNCWICEKWVEMTFT